MEEVDELVETQVGMKKTRSTDYCSQEDVALCLVWMNVSVGTNQTKEKFWTRIQDY